MSPPTLATSAAGGPPRPSNVLSHARAVLPPVCAALGLDGRTQEALEVFEALTDPWGSRALSDLRERHASLAHAREGGPYATVLELGARDGGLRFVVETLADDAADGAHWTAARALTRRLANRYGLSLAPVTRIEDLFVPTAETEAPVWHAASLRDRVPPRFEVLFSAHAQGRWRARALVEEALVRLGLGKAWPDVAERVLRRGLYLDELAFLAIPLTGATDDRGGDVHQVELYVRHYEATADDLSLALGPSPLEGQLDALCVALTGSRGPYRTRAVVTRHVVRRDGALASQGVFLPVASHARNDAVVRGRVSAHLAELGIAPDAYERALTGFAERPLAARAGLQEYVGLALEPQGLALTVELSPDLHPSGRSETVPVPPRASAEDIVRRFEHDIVLADHPFLRRLAREPVHLGPLWLMIANFWEGIVHDFPARVARVIAAIDDDRIRCVLAKQLNDELGEGNYARAHKPMFKTLKDALEPHRLKGSEDVLLAPGRAFGRELGAMMFSDDPHEAVGAMMMIEIYGKQTDLFMGSQFRRQDKLDPAALLWLHLHEGLEVEHAEESFILARCVPDDPAAIAAAWRGAEAIVTAGRHYFDAFYRICFG